MLKVFRSCRLDHIQTRQVTSTRAMSSSSRTPVIFYGYDASPFGAKIENVLALKGIPHNKVDVAMTLPRPEITDLLGINYRRIPVLAVGNDVYCDTSLIAPVLERRFPPEQGFPTLFPPRKDGTKCDTGLVKAFTTFYTDRVLFPPAANTLPYDKFPKAFVEDRSKWFGAPLNIQKMVAAQPLQKSALVSHMALLEEQLSDDREWVLDTKTPGYGDLSYFFVLGWVINFKGMKDILSVDKFPKSRAWIDRMAQFVKARKEANASSVKKIKGDVAAKIIADNANVNVEEVSFDQAEAGRLGLKLGDTVAVVPDDNAKNYPTVGTLVGLNYEQVVIQLSGAAVPSLRVHFPRLNFSIVRKSDVASKL